MSDIIWAGAGLLLLAWAFARRRSIRRWWRTKACPHPNCIGRMPATPVHHDWSTYALEQCEVCQNWCGWASFDSSWKRWKAPKT